MVGGRSESSSIYLFFWEKGSGADCTICCRFKYEPEVLRDVLLFQNQPEDDTRPSSSRPRKRRRLDPSTSSHVDVDDDDDDDNRAPRDIVLETLTEKFLVQSYEAQPASLTPTASANKENVDAMDVDGPPPANDDDEGDLEMELGVPPPFMPPKPKVRVERRWVISLVVDEEGEGRVEKGQVERKEGEGKMVVDVGDDEKAKAAEENAKATTDEVTATTVPTDIVDKPAPKDAGPSTSSDPQLPTVDGPKPAEPTPSTDAEKKEPIPPIIDVPIENKDKQEPTIPGQPSPLPPPPPDSPTISTTSGSGPSNPTPSKPVSSSSTSTAKPKKVAFFDEPKPKDETWKKRATVLQRDLKARNFDFVEGEVRVLGDVGEDGTRRGWVIEARRWWYA